MSVDMRDRGEVTMNDLAASNATDVLVSLEQANSLYTELQQLVRFEECADHSADGFRSLKGPEAWRRILIRPTVERPFWHDDSLPTEGPR